MLNIILSGACGRMGRQVAQYAADLGIRIVAGVDVAAESYAAFPVYPTFALCLEKAEAMIDFSRPENLPALLAFATENKLPLVLATTGYHEAEDALIHQAAKSIAIFRSANLSLGVQVLKVLAHQAASLLPGFDIEIVEKHHNQKIDAPSGTAITLYQAVANADSVPVYGRHSRTERREKREIGLHAVRGGTVPGEHEVGFYGAGETLLLTHTAQDRSIFAQGALRAARYLVAKPAGMYGMEGLVEEMLG